MRSCLLLPMLLALCPAAQATETQPTPADILVNGPTNQGSAWNRAETDHLIVLSVGSEAELRRVAANLERPLTYARTDRRKDKVSVPLVTNLSAAQGAPVEARIMVGEAGDHTPDWRAALRERLAHAPDSPEATLLRAEAACRGGQDDICLAEADRMLATMPDHTAALGWKGVAQVDLALALPVAQRPAALAAARQTIARAIQADGPAGPPVIALFRSYAQAGQPVPEEAILALARLARANPAAPAPSLYLAQELSRQGKDALALSVIAPVLGGAYDPPKRPWPSTAWPRPSMP